MKRWLLIIALVSPVAAQMTQTVATGSRSLSTVYQNTSGATMLFSVWVRVDWNGAAATTDLSLNLFVDTVNPPVVQTCNKSTDVGKPSGTQTSCTAVIPPGAYYKATASSSTGVGLTLAQWTEDELTQLTSGTQNVVTGSRVLGTIYQNVSATNTIWVEVSAASTSANTTLSAICDSAATPTTNVGQETTFSGKNMTLVFPVLPLYYYKVSQDNGATVNTWAEVTTPTPLNMTQNVVTGSRSLSAGSSLNIYQPIANAVIASITGTYSGIPQAGSIGSYSDVANPPAYIVESSSRHLTENFNLFFGVPVRYFYAASWDQTYTLVQWVEWDIPQVVNTFAGEPRRRISN